MRLLACLPNKAHLAALREARLLEIGGCIENRVLEPLEDVEAAVEADLPAGVGADAAGVEIGAGGELKAEGRSGFREGVL